MDTNNRKVVLRALAAVLFSAMLIACGGGQLLQPIPGGAGQPQQMQPEQPVQDPADQPAGGDAVRNANVLKLSGPSLGGMHAGREFEVSLGAEFIEEVYQGSCRLQFDPALIQPVSTHRGDLLPDNMLQIAATDQSGFVAFSFTALPGNPGIQPGSGELLLVRFRLLAAADGTARVRLLNDGQFLQLRDRNGQRLRFDLEASSGGGQ